MLIKAYLELMPIFRFSRDTSGNLQGFIEIVPSLGLGEFYQSGEETRFYNVSVHFELNKFGEMARDIVSGQIEKTPDNFLLQKNVYHQENVHFDKQISATHIHFHYGFSDPFAVAIFLDFLRDKTIIYGKKLDEFTEALLNEASNKGIFLP